MDNTISTLIERSLKSTLRFVALDFDRRDVVLEWPNMNPWCTQEPIARWVEWWMENNLKSLIKLAKPLMKDQLDQLLMNPSPFGIVVVGKGDTRSFRADDQMVMRAILGTQSSHLVKPLFYLYLVYLLRKGPCTLKTLTDLGGKFWGTSDSQKHRSREIRARGYVQAHVTHGKSGFWEITDAGAFHAIEIDRKVHMAALTSQRAADIIEFTKALGGPNG